MERNDVLNAAVLGALGGFVVGFLIGKREVKKLNDRYEEDVAIACAENKAHFERKLSQEHQALEVARHEVLVARKEAATVAMNAYKGSVELSEAATEIDTKDEFYESFAPHTREEVIEFMNSDAMPAAMIADALIKNPNLGPVNPDEFIYPEEESRDYQQDYTPELAPEAVLKTSEKPPRREVVDTSKPYVVSSEEALTNELDWPSSTITYYEGDDTLSGEGDVPMDDRSRLLVVGTNLSNFGEMSGDPNVVYIRNDKLQMYLEVIRNQGTYAEQVAGLGDDG